MWIERRLTEITEVRMALTASADWGSSGEAVQQQTRGPVGEQLSTMTMMTDDG